ncbi:hypothetical protein C8R43DRAFT_1142889 [Mycena crocata]|nr:hypothetical protein C8R43DRAFT_1142889 [Mycena crocata]
MSLQTDEEEASDPRVHIRNLQSDGLLISFILAEFRSQPAGDPQKCWWCNETDVTLFRCKDCFQSLPSCAACCVVAHERWPLHLLDRWTGSLWKRGIKLNSLGYTYQSGHGGLPCPNPAAQAEETRVFAVNGVHRLSTRGCQCNSVVPRQDQLPVGQTDSRSWEVRRLWRLRDMLAGRRDREAQKRGVAENLRAAEEIRKIDVRIRALR